MHPWLHVLIDICWANPKFLMVVGSRFSFSHLSTITLVTRVDLPNDCWVLTITAVSNAHLSKAKLSHGEQKISSQWADQVSKLILRLKVICENIKIKTKIIEVNDNLLEKLESGDICDPNSQIANVLTERFSSFYCSPIW